MSTNVSRNHLMPISPIVAETVPDADGVPDVFLPQLVREIVGRIPQRVGLAGRQNDVESPKLVDPPGVALAADEIDRVMEIHGVVIEAVRESADVVDAA